MTKALKCPKVGDILTILYSGNYMHDHNVFSFGNLHGIPAIVKKVTPAGRLDIEFTPRGSPVSLIQRTHVWSEWSGSAIQNSGPHDMTVWRVSKLTALEANEALALGEKRHHDLIERVCKRNIERIEQESQPDYVIDVRLRRDEIEALIIYMDGFDGPERSAVKTLLEALEIEP